jgi:alkaline phosphatase
MIIIALKSKLKKKHKLFYIILQVIMGGGRSKFLPNTTVDNYNHLGQRRDNRDLIQEWLNKNRREGEHRAYVSDRKELKSLNTTQTDFLFGKYQ